MIAALGCANQHRRGHGGSSALSADIAEEDALAVSWQDAAAVEVVTDLADGVEGHVNAHTGHGIKDARREHALYLLGGLHFPGQNGALAGGLLLLAKQEEEQRDHQAEDRDRLAVGNSVGPMCLKIGDVGNVRAGQAHGEQGHHDQAPRHGENGQRFHAVRNGSPGQEGGKGSEVFQDVKDIANCVQMMRPEAIECEGLRGGEHGENHRRHVVQSKPKPERSRALRQPCSSDR